MYILTRLEEQKSGENVRQNETENALKRDTTHTRKLHHTHTRTGARRSAKRRDRAKKKKVDNYICGEWDGATTAIGTRINFIISRDERFSSLIPIFYSLPSVFTPIFFQYRTNDCVPSVEFHYRNPFAISDNRTIRRVESLNRIIKYFIMKKLLNGEQKRKKKRRTHAH